MDPKGCGLAERWLSCPLGRSMQPWVRTSSRPSFCQMSSLVLTLSASTEKLEEEPHKGPESGFQVRSAKRQRGGDRASVLSGGA